MEKKLSFFGKKQKSIEENGSLQDKVDSVVGSEFLCHRAHQNDVLEIIGLSKEDWSKLEIYHQVHVNELFMLIKELSLKPKSILEWGSGFSTAIFCHFGLKKWDTEYLLTIDHNKKYQHEILQNFEHPDFLKAITMDLTGGIWPWDPEIHNYATYPVSLDKKFDLIFVDGRRRNECLIAASQLITDEGIVIMHDIWRERYEVGMKLFNEIKRYDQYAFLQLPRKQNEAK